MDNSGTTPKRKARRWGFIATGLALVGFLLFVVVSMRPPLVDTDAYSVQYSVRGRSYTDAEVFQPVLMGHLLYVRLPVLADTRYLWFLVDLRRSVVSSPIGPYHSSHGFDYIHSDQAFGVLLTDAKIEDHWTVSFESGVVTFSNDSIHVTVTKRSAEQDVAPNA